MIDKQMEETINNLLAIFPLVHKKLLSPSDMLQETNLSPGHFHLLVVIEKEGALPTTELAKKLSIQKSNLTPLINKLIEFKYVERIQSEADKRYIYVNLTENGKEFLAERKALMNQKIKTKLSTLNDRDLYALDHSLKNVNDIISKIDFDKT